MYVDYYVCTYGIHPSYGFSLALWASYLDAAAVDDELYFMIGILLYFIECICWVTH